ncbi:pyridoxal phosphate-dependent decarboxylase family protein [Telluribacter humicola]|uniref:pyridoxal phosphate-dependent decarboxylase family protein n=1 Tax=Telluribacter humicola TaxID=1720261 RepID=UPI001A95B3A2|nr:aminotransferase class I/II-fold pyridoxal phosphate-dependent enzyme [Telluribacter humicola]
MENILDQAYSADNFRQQGHALIDMMADYLERTTSEKNKEKTIQWQPPTDQLATWQEDAQQPLADPLELFQDAIARSIHLHNPRYMGHQTTPPLPVTVLSSAVSALLNQGQAVYEMGMVGNSLEKIMSEYLARKLGFGSEASGFLTSGGSLGNLTALLAARAAVSNVWNEGHQEGQRWAVLVSEEAHYCIDRAARIMGLGTEGIIKVPVNERYQMRTDQLEQYYQQAISEGKQVLCVVGCACTTSTGSYDNLEAIAAFCQKYNLWFHVDGAHGAPAAFSPKYKHLVKGIEQADSVVVDYHKMMMTPSLSTAVIFKRSGDSYKTFAQRAQYLWAEQPGEEEWYNGGKRSVECTKNMSILNVYTILRTYGETIFRENIDRLYGLATTFAAQVRTNPAFELAYEPECNIVCLRYLTECDTNSFNQQIRQLLLEEGDFFIVQTILKGQTYLRVSLMNPLTTERELQELLGNIEQKAAYLLAHSH